MDNNQNLNKYADFLIMNNKWSDMNILKNKIIKIFEDELLPLNKNGIYHRDLKLENMIISPINNGVVNIDDSDLGIITSDLEINMNKEMPGIIITGNVQYNAPLSAAIMIQNDGTYVQDIDNFNIYKNFMDNISNPPENVNEPENVDNEEKHLEIILKILYIALGNTDHIQSLLVGYADLLKNKYSTSLQNKKLNENDSFSKDYHRGVDIWGLVMVFGYLLMEYKDQLHENTKGQIINVVLELYTEESIKMGDEQIEKILHMLRAIDFTLSTDVRSAKITDRIKTILKRILQKKKGGINNRKTKKQKQSGKRQTISKIHRKKQHKKTYKKLKNRRRNRRSRR